MKKPIQYKEEPQDQNRVLLFLVAAAVLILGSLFAMSTLKPKTEPGPKAPVTQPVIGPEAGKQDASLKVEAVNAVTPPAAGQEVEQPPPAATTIQPPPSRTVEKAPVDLWVTVNELNVRSEPGARGQVLEDQKLYLGDKIVANGVQIVTSSDGPREWYRVNTGRGYGWVNSKYVSSTPVTAPPPPTEDTPSVQDSVPIPQNLPAVDMSQLLRRADSGWYVQSGAAIVATDAQDLARRYRDAADCVGYSPKLYASDAFTKTKRAGMLLIAYGPFTDKPAAERFRSRLLPCVNDAFVSNQPW